MDNQYFELLNRILEEGTFHEDRTGVGTKAIFGHVMTFDLQDGFPAQTTKKLAWNAVVAELMWFLEGSDDERRLAELTFRKDRSKLNNHTTIWTKNANKQGVELGYTNNTMNKILGPVYGVQWRCAIGSSNAGIIETDQIRKVIDQIKNDPNSRRIILSAWNPSEIQSMALPPCHMLAQFIVRDGKLSCMMTQRSADSFLGVPFNIASYALLTHILARECGLDVGKLVISLGDAHIYMNHLDQVNLVLSREPYPLPKLEIDSSFDLESVLMGDSPLDVTRYFQLRGYVSHESVKADMAE